MTERTCTNQEDSYSPLNKPTESRLSEMEWHACPLVSLKLESQHTSTGVAASGPPPPLKQTSQDAPSGPAVQHLPANAGDRPCSGKSPHAVEPLSPCATTTEAHTSRALSPQRDTTTLRSLPTHHNSREPARGNPVQPEIKYKQINKLKLKKKKNRHHNVALGSQI